MSKTKITGYLMVAVAVLNVGIDALNGGGFDFTNHITSVTTALSGAGFVFLRDAVSKLQTK